MDADSPSRTSTTLLVLLRDPADPQAWQAFVERYTPKVLGLYQEAEPHLHKARDLNRDALGAESANRPCRGPTRWLPDRAGPLSRGGTTPAKEL